MKVKGLGELLNRKNSFRQKGFVCIGARKEKQKL